MGIRPHPSTIPPSKRSPLVLPVLIGVGVAIALALGLLVLLLRGKSGTGFNQLPAPDRGSATMPASAAPPLILSPDLPAEPSGGALAAKPAPPVAKTNPASTAAAPAAPSPAPLAVPGPVAAPPAAPAARTAAPTASSARGLRCYSDPFTGQIRIAGAGHVNDSFACQQNPFTGAYQRK